MTIGNSEINAILAGLRAIQDNMDNPKYRDVLTDGNTVKPLDLDQIDMLCEEINSGGICLNEKMYCDSTRSICSERERQNRKLREILSEMSVAMGFLSENMRIKEFDGGYMYSRDQLQVEIRQMLNTVTKRLGDMEE